MENLQGKCVLLCVSGGIAAYKMPNVASALRKAGAEVHVVMTQNAQRGQRPAESGGGGPCGDDPERHPVYYPPDL